MSAPNTHSTDTPRTQRLLDEITRTHPEEYGPSERQYLIDHARQLERKLDEAKADAEAVRELMNAYNLGGWTDAVAPMKRALKAEADLKALGDNLELLRARMVLATDDEIMRQESARSETAPTIPEELFDGNAVYAELDVRAQTRTSATNVADALDSVVRLIRARLKKADPQVTGPSPCAEIAAPSQLDMSPEARLKDAESDVLRLHGEKMKFFERVIELERQLAAAGIHERPGASTDGEAKP